MFDLPEALGPIKKALGFSWTFTSRKFRQFCNLRVEKWSIQNPSATPARSSTSIALLAGAVPHHREVLALGAHVAGVALHDGLGAALGGEGFGFCGLLRRCVGEEGGGVFGDFFGEFGRAFLVVALEGGGAFGLEGDGGVA